MSYIEESIHDPSIQQNPSQIPLGDLREKLQKNNVNSQRIAGNGGGPGTEDDECEEARERRNRFQPERTIIPPKMNLKIPDSLENVVTMEHARPPAFRGRGRGRGVRGIRGGRFPTQGNYNPRYYFVICLVLFILNIFTDKIFISLDLVVEIHTRIKIHNLGHR